MSTTEERTEEIRTENRDACPLVQSLDEFGTTWRLNVLVALQDGEKRFNELKRSTAARSKTLSDALDSLTDAGLVAKRMEKADPVAVYYGLTEKGEALAPALAELEDWGREWVDGVPAEESRPRLR
jgi:DNA-binding HxlR family transcriptional regulator